MKRLGVEEVYQKLLKFYGNQNWWPAETPFEVCVGAVLTQNTAWSNVEKAIHNLKKANLLYPEEILKCSRNDLAEKIKPAGFHKRKAEYLQNLSRFIVESGGLEFLKSYQPSELRKELLSVKGIGKETADSILLYALGKPVFVVDAYTKRFFARLGLITSEKLNYEEIRKLVESVFAHRKDKVEVFNELHALIVKHCKTHCRKAAMCSSCFLKQYCRYAKIALELKDR